MVRALNLAVVAFAAALSALTLPRLPERVAVHWNAYGQPDGFGPPLFAALLMPAVMVLLLGLFAVLPRLSPRGYTLEEQRGVYDGVVLVTLVFMLFVHAVMLAAALGVPVRIERVIPFGISMLFAALGPFIARAKQNFYVGVRTPWTITSEANWVATHRFAGRLFVFGGLALALAAIAGASFWLVFAGFMALGFLPVAYSLVHWLKHRAA